jgi:DNA-binding transcriptional ArsR family regulator
LGERIGPNRRRSTFILAQLCKYEYTMDMATAAAPSPNRSKRGRSSDMGESPRWELYRLLSDPTRLRLLALSSLEELAVSELADLLRMSEPKISRHAAALRDAGLLHGRKQGTWLLLRLAPGAEEDPVVADALSAGMELCTADESTERVGEVVARRDAATREFFARGGRAARSGPPEELAAYLRALAPIISPRRLAVDVGTGDGALLEVLAPLFEQVIAVDRSNAQLDLARQRAARRQFNNVRFVCGEIDAPEVRKAVAAACKRKRAGADVVFAARVLHHAAVPAKAMKALVELARPATASAGGGAVFVLDYEHHGDDALRERQADLWLGFEPTELARLAEEAGVCDVERGRIPKTWRGDGPDSHVAWQWLAGRRA